MFLSQIGEDEVIGIVMTCKHKTSTDSMSVIKKSYSTHYIAIDSNI